MRTNDQSPHAYVAVAALALVTLVGCGGGSNDDGSGPDATPTPLSATPTGTPTPTASATPLPTVTPFDGAALAGTYDATTDPPWNAASLAVVTPIEGGVHLRVDLDALYAIDVTATPNEDGTFALAGNYIDGDAYVGASGRATATVGPDEVRIAGAITSFFGGVGFTLVRPTAGTPVSVAGNYELRFTPSPSLCGCTRDQPCDCPSRTSLALALTASDGTATLGPGLDVSHTGIPGEDTPAMLGRFDTLACRVSATGRLRCTGTYHPIAGSGPHDPIFTILQGGLPGPSGAGTGEFDLGGAPPLGTGTWQILQ